MRECWINVYRAPDGSTRHGCLSFPSRDKAIEIAGAQPVWGWRDGVWRVLYRIRVRMKGEPSA